MKMSKKPAKKGGKPMKCTGNCGSKRGCKGC